MRFFRFLTAIAIVLLLGFTQCSKLYICPKGIYIDGCAYRFNYNPVCGCDGVTYDNEGEAACHGIKKYVQGECIL